MNRTLYLLWFSDIFILTGFGLVSPILAIFISNDILGGSIMAAGIASAIFLCTKALVQIPFSRYIDTHNKKIIWLYIGTLLIISVPIQYYYANTITSIYIAQFIYGVGAGLASPAWLSIWSKHLDPDHEAFEWSVYFGTISIGTAISAFIGGTLATYIGFRNTMLIMELLSIIGVVILLRLQNDQTKETQSKTTIDSDIIQIDKDISSELNKPEVPIESSNTKKHKYKYHKHKHQ